MNGVTVRPYAAGDEAGINDGFNAVFGRRRALDEWRWKYPEAPEGRWIMIAAGPSGTTMAHYGAVPVRLQVDGLEVRAGQIADAFTRPEARRGLAAARTYVAVVRAFFELFGAPSRLAVLYGFPGERHLKLGLARLGYDRMAPQPVPVWRRGTARARFSFHAHRVDEGFDAASVDELWRRSSRRYPVAAVRDSAWVARRFTNRPGVEYIHLVARRRGRPAAMAVLRLAGDGAAVAELVWDGEDPRALDSLDRAIAAHVRRAGARAVEMWLGGDDRAAARLPALGWEKASHPAGLAMVARSFDPRIEVSGFVGRFYVTMSDADLV